MLSRSIRRRLLGAITILTLWAGSGGEAAAVCRKECSGGAICDHLSGDARWNCIRGPSAQSCRTVCRDGYGAIAYSGQTGAWGYSFDHETQGRADNFAMRQCARRAADCRVVTGFVNACGALAEGTGKVMASRTGGSRGEAEASSLAACRAAGGGDCSVTVWACNSK